MKSKDMSRGGIYQETKNIHLQLRTDLGKQLPWEDNQLTFIERL